MPINSYATPISAGYRTRRQTRPRSDHIPTSPYQRLYAFDDIDAGVEDQGHGQPVGYVLVDQPPTRQIPRPAPPQYSVRTDTCPLCGGASYHTHGDYIYEVPVESPPTAYVIQGSPRTRPPRAPRRRSKSASSRVRHYSPDGRQRARYIVKEYYTESSESDDDIVISRERSRGSRRRGRKYRKSRSDFDDELNQSLNLTEEIDELTRKMMDTVDGELRKARRKKEFGSSIW